ncbi:hypothetical protein VTK73DRAFT_302 [Phialemonium thermophilum]|uniref:Peptidase A1 domain-containing protein n=1 Tax=Phialemonium thermophilum TaxID=223376 RepID=A0ABR3XFJ3_9PEZI
MLHLLLSSVRDDPRAVKQALADFMSKLQLPSKKRCYERQEDHSGRTRRTSTLGKRTDGRADTAAILASLNGTLSKYKQSPLPPIPPLSKIQKRDSNEPLTDNFEADLGEDIDYFGFGIIGKGDGKPQKFSFVFDTGSSDFWIPGPACTADEGCNGTTKYDEGGIDLHSVTTVSYGSGQITGEDFKDDVTVADLTADYQTLISVTNAVGFTTTGADGLMGMAFSNLAQDNGTTFFENLIAQGKVRHHEFSFFLGRNKSETQSLSELTLGGRDTTKFRGNPTVIHVTEQGFWQVAIQNVIVNGTNLGVATTGQGAIDTGTTLLIAPINASLAIFDAIPGSIALNFGAEILFAFPCNTTANFLPQFVMTDKAFGLNPLDFNLGPLDEIFLELLTESGQKETAKQLAADDDDGFCISAVAGADIVSAVDGQTLLYVMGDTFIKNWYSIFSFTAAPGGKPAVLLAEQAIGGYYFH